jgi:outer membrane protein assembly factor BamB
MPRGPASILAACTAAALSVGAWASPQQSVIVPTVADSPTAKELISRAREQAGTNPAESARLAAELLRDLSGRLVEGDRPGVYQGVADQVAALLAAEPKVLERYRAEVGAQAREWLAGDRLLEVATRFAATDAGLEAMLRLAGRALQDARADEARAWVRRASAHPSASLDPAPRLALGAMAAWAAGDAPAWTAAVEALSAVPGVPADLLDAVRGMGPPPASVHRVERSETTGDPSATLPGLPWAEAWSMPLVWSPASIRTRGTMPMEDQLERLDAIRNRLLRLHTIVPIIVDGEVIVADGRTVASIDLLTHSVRWHAMLAVDDATRASESTLTPCVVDAEHVLTAVSVGEAGGTVSSRVVAVRRDDGRIGWQRSLADADAVLPGGLRVAGSMALVGDVLAVPCLRQAGRLELACWMVGLDAADGATRWAVPIGAANGLLQEFGGTQTFRPGMGAVAHEGCLVVATQVGTSACIEASTGAVRWIARDDQSMVRLRAEQPWESMVPVIAGDAAWFLHADGRAVTQRSLADGHVVTQLAVGPGEPLGAPRWLLGADGLVVGVEADGGLCAVEAGAPTQRTWTIPAVPEDPVVGRAVLARLGGARVIALPRGRRIDLHDLATGASIGSAPVSRGGNLGIGGDRVAVASELSLEVLGQGERILADLVALVEREDAADAEIALAESALAMGDLARALEMARRAMERIGSSPEDEGAASSGSRIFDVLLALVRKAPDGGEAVDALRSAAVLPNQRLRVSLALAERHELRGEWVEAARTLAGAMPALAEDGLVEHLGARVRTGQVLSIAMQRLVVRAHGAGSDAVERAAESARAGAADRAEAFARAWRGTDASITALVDASERAASDGRPDDAARCAQRAALLALERAASGLPVQRALVDRVASRIIDAGTGDLLAVTTLRRLGAVAPGGEAFARLAVEAPWVLSPRRAAVAGEPRKGRRAIQFTASMPAIDRFAAQQATPGLGLLVVNQQLVGVEGAALTPAWSLEVEDQSPGIVRLHPVTMVLERTMTLPGRLRGLDVRTGLVAWTIEDLGAALGPVRPVAGLRDDEAALSRRGQFAVVPLGDGGVAVRGDGSCSRIAAGGAVGWVSQRSLPLVDHVQAALGSVALVGTSLSSDPALTILSGTTGQERGSIQVESLAGVEELHATLAGFVVTRGLASAMVEDTEAGPRILWERASPPGATRRTAQVVLHEAMFQGQPGDGSFRVDLDDGSSTPLDWDEGTGGAWSPLLELDEGLLFAKGDRVLLARADGAIVGSARLAPSSTPQSAVACAGGVLVQALEMPELPAVQGGSTITLLDAAEGLRQVQGVARVMIPVGWRRSMLLDGWLLQFGDDQCIAVPVGPS